MANVNLRDFFRVRAKKPAFVVRVWYGSIGLSGEAPEGYPDVHAGDWWKGGSESRPTRII